MGLYTQLQLTAKPPLLVYPHMRACAGPMTRTRARECDDPHASCRRASKCTRPRYAKFNTKKTTTTTQQTENVMKNETKPPYFLFFQKRFAPSKMFHKNNPPKNFTMKK